MTDEQLLASMRRAITDASAIVDAGSTLFTMDPLLQRTAKNIITEIGEAAASLSDRTRSERPEVPWRLIIGMRHKVVHDYAEIDLTILWNTLMIDPPQLEVALSLTE